MNSKQKKLLLKFRDALKKAGIIINAKNVSLMDETASIDVDWLNTNSDYSSFEISIGVKKIILSKYQEFRTTEKNKVREE